MSTSTGRDGVNGQKKAHLSSSFHAPESGTGPNPSPKDDTRGVQTNLSSRQRCGCDDKDQWEVRGEIKIKIAQGCDDKDQWAVRGESKIKIAQGYRPGRCQLTAREWPAATGGRPQAGILWPKIANSGRPRAKSQLGQCLHTLVSNRGKEGKKMSKKQRIRHRAVIRDATTYRWLLLLEELLKKFEADLYTPSGKIGGASVDGRVDERACQPAERQWMVDERACPPGLLTLPFRTVSLPMPKNMREMPAMLSPSRSCRTRACGCGGKITMIRRVCSNGGDGRYPF